MCEGIGNAEAGGRDVEVVERRRERVLKYPEGELRE
jgi:hypothetical protein